MSTHLTTPIEKTNTASIQDITRIYMILEHGQIEYHIETRAEDGEPTTDPEGNPHTPKGEVFAKNTYMLNFSDAPPAVKDHLRAVLDDVRGHARANGYLGEGTDTDPIG